MINEQEQAKTNLSECARKLPAFNHVNVVNGKIISNTKDLFNSLGVDYVG